MEGGGRITLRNSSEWKKSVDTISILVVDDDTTCLSIVAATLKKFKYEVVTVKHPNDALCTLRIKGGAFDLVISDVHMPDMNGFELQQAIAQEFNLPVVLMSADDKEGVALKGLESGAAFFILKPVSPDDLRDLWQFAAMKKTSTQVVIEETGSLSSIGKNTSDEIVISATSVSEDTVNKKYSKRKSPRKEGSDEKKGENSQSASQKKPKVIWTNSLHNRFLEAIRSIGLDRAVPKKILEAMNVPGLTRENVASHLQKYRIFLRRVSDASYKIQYSADKGLSRNLRSSCESSGIRSPPSTLTLNRFSTKVNYQNPRQFPASDARFALLPNLEASASSNHIPQSGIFGQSRLLSNRASWLKPNFGNSNLMMHHNEQQRPYARLAQNSCPSATQGHLANISLEDLSTALSASFDAFPASSSYNDVPYQKNVGTWGSISSSSSSPSKNFTYRPNYVGYSIANIKHLTKSGHCEKYEGLNSCGGITDHFPGHDEQLQSRSTHVHGALTVPNENSIYVGYQLGQHVGASNPFVTNNNGGEQLCDVIADYRMLLFGAENGGGLNESAFTPTFDLSEFDILSTQQPLEEGGFQTTLADQVNNIQNQAQQNGSKTTTNSNLYGEVSHWDNRVPSFDQAPNQHQSSQGLMNSQGFGTSSHLNETVPLPTNKQQVYEDLTNSPEFGSSQLSKTLLPLTERDDDDFLESLLTPFGEDQTLEGI